MNHLQTYLPSVLTHTPSDVAIWVVDNGSEDASVDWLQNNVAERVQVLELKENHGFAGGYNRALDHIDADMYVLLNSDVRVEGDWVTPVLECMGQRIGMWQVPGSCKTSILDCASTPVRQEDGWTRTGIHSAWDESSMPWNQMKIGMRATGKCFGRQERAFHPKICLAQSGWFRQRPVCPHGRNRFVLEAQK